MQKAERGGAASSRKLSGWQQRFIDWSSFFALVFFASGIVLQILKTVARRSVADISLGEISLRVLATFIILVKYLTTRDKYLIAGHAIFTLTLLSYAGLVVYFYFRR